MIKIINCSHGYIAVETATDKKYLKFLSLLSYEFLKQGMMELISYSAVYYSVPLDVLEIPLSLSFLASLMSLN